MKSNNNAGRQEFLDKLYRIGIDMHVIGKASINVFSVFMYRCKIEFDLTDEEFNELWKRLMGGIKNEEE